MPRTSRKLSETGIHHVMLRGIDHIQLFYDEEDHLAFLERLARYKNACRFSLLAYAMMGNHVHLLIKEGERGISEDIKGLTTSYAHWYNNKYGRSGYLFQGRFRSEPITTDSHLLAAFRYIHNNPVKIGLPMSHWTSYEDYIGTPSRKSTLADTSFISGMFDDRPDTARKLLVEFFEAAEDERLTFIEDDQKVKTKDADAIEIIKEIARVRFCGDLASMDKDSRDFALATCKKRGLSVRQLARLTGMNRNVIQRACSTEE